MNLCLFWPPAYLPSPKAQDNLLSFWLSMLEVMEEADEDDED